MQVSYSPALLHVCTVPEANGSHSDAARHPPHPPATLQYADEIMIRSLVRKLGLAVVAALLVAACKPKLGGKCTKDGKEACADKASALVCHDGTWSAMACRGAMGCISAGDSASCDNMNAEENDICNLDGDYACTMDKKAYLQCEKRTWKLAGSCRGQNGCQVNTKHVKCDSSVARLDDPCMKDDEGDHACADDKKTSLVCRGAKFVLAGKCGGPQGCRLKQGDEVDCDDSSSDIGDPCDLADHFACSKDGRALLACKAGKFTKDEDCKKKTCKVQGDKVGCL
jgi:hypothetical protein